MRAETRESGRRGRDRVKGVRQRREGESRMRKKGREQNEKKRERAE